MFRPAHKSIDLRRVRLRLNILEDRVTPTAPVPPVIIEPFSLRIFTPFP